MTVKWESSLNTGCESVDLQHQYFMDLINRIEKDYKASNDDAYSQKLIEELKKYAEFHFASEENIATSMKLPGIAGHHQRHQELLGEFKSYAEELSQRLISIDQFLQFLTDWFTGHTYYEDQKLFGMIK